ncbi:MAG TPA: acyl-CoA dehydrogenase family protein [Thermoleophilia bacterium]|nr:acyl-CoA dehydrogenase family protein [Thermoleophilia bacterium]
MPPEAATKIVECVRGRWGIEYRLRDSKVFDILEGTGQVQRLVIARRILGYTSKELA